ncbi:MAG: IS110 family transposase, partial [Rhodanobacteraceae bacterium]
MNKSTAIAIDLAKHIFQIAAENAQREIVWEGRLKSREAMHAFLAKLEPPMTVAFETGPGAQAWAREIQARGVEVRILPAQHTAAHRSGNKNDTRDAHAILYALHDVNVHPVPVKTQDQLTLQALHRARQGWRGRMTAIGNQVRGLLLEHAVVIAQGDAALVRTTDRALEDATLPIPDRLRALVAELMGERKGYQERLAVLDGELATLSRTDPVARHLREVRGIGPITSTALACKGIHPDQFADSRQFAAYFGITPSQHSSGPKIRLGHMSRRGDTYLRSILIEGAHSVIRQIRSDASDPYSRRIQRWVKR